jgi:hypothetical protein
VKHVKTVKTVVDMLGNKTVTTVESFIMSDVDSPDSVDAAIKEYERIKADCDAMMADISKRMRNIFR